MSTEIIAAMGNATLWSAVAPDGSTPSTAVTIADLTEGGDGSDRTVGVVTAADGADGHALRRTVDGIDLTKHAELQMDVRAPSPENRGAGRFLIELRLGSATRPVQNSPDEWHRLVSAPASRGWETLRFTLDDLPADVAQAVDMVQLRCVAAPFVLHIDDLTAVEAHSLFDCDHALTAAFGTVMVGETEVNLVVGPTGEAPAGPPRLDVVQVDARYAPHRVLDGRVRRDYTTRGFREATAGTPYDVDYAITPVAETREHQAALLEALLDRLPAHGELVADGETYPIELLSLPGSDRVGGAVSAVPVLLYRVGTRGPARIGAPVHEVQHITVSTDLVVTA